MTAIELNELIDSVDALEQRIHGGPLPAGHLIDGEQLQQLLIAAAALQRRSGGGAPPPELLAAVWRVIRSGADAALQDGEPAHRHLALIQIADRLFDNLAASSDIDPRAFAVIRNLLPGMARVLVADTGALLRPDHPARSLLDLLFTICQGYDRFSGRGAEALMTAIGGIIQTASASPRPHQEAYEEAYQGLVELLNQYNRETSELAKGTISKERGNMQSQDAKLAVNREILKAVNGKRLPPMLLEFLQKVWSKYLYVTHLRHGMNCNIWNQAIFDIHVLVRSLSEWDREEFFLSNAKQLPTTLSRIRQGTASIHTDEDLTARFLAAMKNLLAHVAQGHMPVLAQTVLVATEDFPVDTAAAPPDQETLTVVATLAVGHWYKLSEQGVERRCRLIEKNMHYHYCMFTNYSGIKVAKLDFTRLADQVRSGALQRIELSPVFDTALADACTQVRESLIPELQSQATEVERERAAALERQRQSEEAERLRRIEQERLREKARRLEEKLHQQQEQRRRAAEAKAELERQQREQALALVLKNVDKLQSGASMELIEQDGTRVYCKLGLRLKSSGKLIFVDRLGRKVKELMPRELAERIADGSAGIVNFGIDFEDTLKNLIVDRSGKIQAEEER